MFTWCREAHILNAFWILYGGYIDRQMWNAVFLKFVTNVIAIVNGLLLIKSKGDVVNVSDTGNVTAQLNGGIHKTLHTVFNVQHCYSFRSNVE